MKNLNKGMIQLIVTLMAISFAAAVWAENPAPETPVVNINKASEVELAYLPGVGPTTAANIIQYRKRQPFQKAQHLMRVKGIGRKTFAKIQKYIVVEGPTTATKKIKSAG